MSTVANLRREDPFLLDTLISRGACATVRSVKSRKRYASALRIDPSRASRHRRGDEHSPATNFLVDLALAEGGSAWPMIAEGVAVVIQQTLKKATIEQLRARLHELSDIEHDAEANENRRMMRELDQTQSREELIEWCELAAAANVREVELQLERAAILRELASRARRGS